MKTRARNLLGAAIVAVATACAVAVPEGDPVAGAGGASSGSATGSSSGGSSGAPGVSSSGSAPGSSSGNARGSSSGSPTSSSSGSAPGSSSGSNRGSSSGNATSSSSSSGGSSSSGSTHASSSGGSSSSSGGSSSSSGGGSRALGGTVTYDFVPASVRGLEFAAAKARPVRGATVQVLKGTAVLATTTTDETGRYALSFKEPAGAGALQLLALAECEAPPIRVVDNTDGAAIWAVGAALDGTTSTKDLHAAHGWKGTAYDAAARVAAPFAILDTMYGAAKALAAVRPATFPPLKVNWSPKNTTSSGDFAQGQIGSTCFTPGVNEIHVLGKEGVDTDEFDTHVLAHEWGHYFTHALSRSDNPGGAHAFGEKLDPRMAFDEGSASALSAMLLSDALYVDTYWSTGQIVAGSFDLETPPTPTDDPSPGPFSEGTAMRLVYDVYDAGAGEAFDGVGVGLGVVVDVFTGFVKTTPAETTIAAFVAGVKQHASATAATRSAIDALLAHYGIGPITDASGAGDAALSQWFASHRTSSPAASASAHASKNVAASAAPPPTPPWTAPSRPAPEAP